MTHAIMFQGTGSDVGKTVLVAGFCRLAANRGIKVVPFKPQNMSNNAAVAHDGGEIGRGQWLQALAARVPPSVHMNPILLKPQSEVGSQVVVHGQSRGHAKAREYKAMKPQLLSAVLESYQIISKDADLVLVEGAGSPAEINLRAGDIANMGFATEANVPVILIGDIDRGGVIASLVGTHKILPDTDRDMIKGFLINKFRGDVSLFDDGITSIKEFTDWDCFGVIPWLKSVSKLPAEDSVALDKIIGSSSKGSKLGAFKIAVPRLPRIANFDDFDPLLSEPNINLQFIEEGYAIPSDADLVILPGSKSTIADLIYLKEQGWGKMLQIHCERGGRVIGICGGYQMLGAKIFDPEHVEGPIEEIDGFGLLDIQTIMEPRKVTENVTAQSMVFDAPIKGYEIHIGRTDGADCAKPFAMIDGQARSDNGPQSDGAISPNGKVVGTYLHGLFVADGFRQALLASFGVDSTQDNYEKMVDDALDELAEELDALVDFDALLQLSKTAG
jgi:adenosylcobyric acid synthase